MKFALKRRIGAAGTAAVLASVISGTLVGCSSEQRERASDMTSYSSIPQEQMSHVQVVTVQPTKLTRTLRLTGAVAYNAFSTTPVITQVGGPVSRILVVPGERVKKGQPLLDVSSPDYSVLLAAYLKAKDAYRVAGKNYDRAKDLFEHHAVSERDLLQAESDKNQAQADLFASEQGLKVLGITNPDSLLAKIPSGAEVPVLAPISGEVVERLVAPGQVLTAGTTQAFTISDMSTVWVLANIYQADLAFVRTGDDVVVQTDAYPDSFHGKISYLSAALDPNTRTLQARIVVDNPGEKLKRDMYCTVTVTAGSIQNAIAVPDAAILRDDENEPFVYVAVGPTQFGRRQIEVGESQNGKTQILRGLSAGEKIVGDGSLFLQFANALQH
jgi:membrane fusion protein, heavy metal efflux system